MLINRYFQGFGAFTLPGSRLLLVVDQFEEIYTLCPFVESRQTFIDGLLNVCADQQPFSPTVVITLRADFLGKAMSYQPLGKALQDFPPSLLVPMSRKELERAITKPAARFSVELESGLVNKLIDDVGSGEGSLPLQQFALTQLWGKQLPGLLTHQAYTEIGGVTQALTNHAEAVYAGLSAEQQQRAQRVFIQLVQPGESTEDTRRLATRDEVEDYWDLVTLLANERLLVTNRNQLVEDTVEVVHEALIRNWGRLQGWMDDNREIIQRKLKIEVTAKEWQEKNKSKDYLLSGVKLTEAQKYIRSYPDINLSKLAIEFLAQSIILRRSKRLWKTGFAALIATGALVGNTLTFLGGRKAADQLAKQSQLEIIARVYQELDAYLEIPHQINQLNLLASKSGTINLKDFQITGKYFLQQAKIFSRTGYIQFGNSKGEFIGAGQENGEVLISEKLVNTPYKLFAVDHKGNRTGIVQVKPEAHPNDAEWYTDAAKSKKPIWSAVYNWQDSPDVLAISSSYPVYDNNSSLIGVLSVDLLLTEINRFLRRTKTSLSGEIFIIERNGMVIASSTEQQPFLIENGKIQRIKAIQLKSPLLKATANYLQQHFGDFNKIEHTQQLSFAINGKNQFLQVTPWKENFGLDWLIVIILPESDVMQQIYSNTAINFLIFWGVLLIIIVIVLF